MSLGNNPLGDEALGSEESSSEAVNQTYVFIPGVGLVAFDSNKVNESITLPGAGEFQTPEVYVPEPVYWIDYTNPSGPDTVTAINSNGTKDFVFNQGTATYYYVDNTKPFLQTATESEGTYPICSERGLLLENRPTNNYCLWNRDLTNAVWTKTNATVERGVGYDNVENSASIITSQAGGNGSVTQDITFGNALNSVFVFDIKALNVTGTVSYTIDGTTWVDITSQVSSNWNTIYIQDTSLQTSRTFGIRLGNQLNSVAVDFMSALNTGDAVSGKPQLHRRVTEGSILTTYSTSVSASQIHRANIPKVQDNCTIYMDAATNANWSTTSVGYLYTVGGTNYQARFGHSRPTSLDANQTYFSWGNFGTPNIRTLFSANNMENTKNSKLCGVLGDKIYYYIDGVLGDTTGASGSGQGSNRAAAPTGGYRGELGAPSAGTQAGYRSSYFFKEFQLFDVALTPSQVNALPYKGEATREGFAAQETQLTENTFSVETSYVLNAEAGSYTETGSTANLYKSIYTIGASGDYTNITDFYNFVDGLGILHSNIEAHFIDDAIYPVNGNHNYLTLNFNGFKVIYRGIGNGKHNGTYSGARLERSSTSVAIDVRTGMEFYDLCFKNTRTDNALAAITGITCASKFSRCIFVTDSMVAEHVVQGQTGSGAFLDMESCLVIAPSGSAAICYSIYQGASSTLTNCTAIGGSVGLEYGGRNDKNTTTTVTNFVSYGATTPFVVGGIAENGVSNNCASEMAPGSLPAGPTFNNYVQLTADPFVNSAGGNYKPKRQDLGGQLDNAGTTISITEDLSGEPIDERPPIGAFEDDSGIKDIGTTGSFSSISNWVTYVKSFGTITRNEEGRLIDDAVYTEGASATSSALDFTGYSGAFDIILKGHGSGLPGPSGVSGARIEENVSSDTIYDNIRECTLQDLIITNTNGGWGAGIQARANSTIRRVRVKARAYTFMLTNNAVVESCISIVTNDSLSRPAFDIIGGNQTLINCTAISTVSTLNYGFGFRAGNHSGEVRNCVAYNCLEDFRNDSIQLNGTYSNNASEDTTVNTVLGGTNNVVLTADPFVDFAGGDYRAALGSELDGAGIVTSATTGLYGNTFSNPPPIGATEPFSTATYTLVAEAGSYSKTGSTAELIKSHHTIGVGGDFTTVGDWYIYIKGIAPMQQDQTGLLIDDAVYPITGEPLDFFSSDVNGFTLTLKGSGSGVPVNGTYSGARLEKSDTTRVSQVRYITLEDLCIKNTNSASTARAVSNNINATFNRVVFGYTSGNNYTIITSNSDTYNSCLILGDLSIKGTGSAVENCTVIGHTNGIVATESHTGTMNNTVSYGAIGFSTSGGSFSGTYSNNAASDATAIGSNPVQLSGDPFVSSGTGDYRPVRNGQLDNVGATTSLTTDITGEPFDERPPIGAFEDDSGIKDIGSTGSYSTIGNWTTYVKGITTLTRNEQGVLIDNANYTRSNVNDLNFNSVTLNGYTITFKSDPSVRHTGTPGTGARISAGPSDRLYICNSLIIEGIEFENTSGTDRIAIRLEQDCSLKNCIVKTTDAALYCVETFRAITIENNLIIGGNESLYCNGDWSFGNILHNTIISNGTVGLINVSATQFNATVQNNVVYGSATTCYSFAAVGYTFTNNASSDATGNIQLSGDPFVDSAGGDYRPVRQDLGGQLDNAGVATSLTTDIVGEPLDERPPIGAFEDDSGVKDIGAAGSFSTITNWANYVKGLSSLTRNEEGRLIDNSLYAAGAQDSLDFSLVTLNSNTIKLTGHGSGVHNGTNSTGARVEEITPNEDYIYLPVSNVTLEKFSIKHTRTIGFNQGCVSLDDNGIVRNMVFESLCTSGMPVSGTVGVIGSSTGTKIEGCLIIGNSQAIVVGAGTEITNNTCVGQLVNGIYANSTYVSTIKNNAFYNQSGSAVREGYWSTSTLDSNATDSGYITGTNAITLAGDPFVNSAGGDYRPVRNGELDNAGVSTSLTTDLVGEPLDERPPIGAFEDDSGVKDIGSTGSYSTITNWANYVKALGTLSRNEEGRLIDNAVYSISQQDLNFSSVTLNSNTIYFKGFGSGIHDGTFNTGARISGDSADYLAVVRSCIVEDLSFEHIATSGGNKYTLETADCTFRRVLSKTGSTGQNSCAFGVGNDTILESCFGTGGQRVLQAHGDVSATNCTFVNGSEYGIFSFGNGATQFYAPTVITNTVAYNNGTADWSVTNTTGYSGSNNATSDGSHLPGSGNNVTLTGDPFVDSAGGDYRAASGSELDGAGVLTSVTIGLYGNTFSNPPPIGATEPPVIYNLLAESGSYSQQANIANLFKTISEDYNTWGRRHKITIDNTKVAENLTNFPALITLDHLNAEVVDAGSNSALNGGADIRFTVEQETGQESIALVQENILNFVTSSSPTLVQTFSTDVTPGSTVLVIADWYRNGGVTTATCADNIAGAYTQVDPAYGPGGTQMNSAFYYPNHPGGTVTVTVTLAGSAPYRGMWITEWSGVDPINPVEDANHLLVSNPPTTTDGIVAASVTTATNNAVVASWHFDIISSGGTMEAGTGWTAGLKSTTNGVFMGEYKTIASPSTVSPTFTASNGHSRLTTSVALKPASITAHEPIPFEVVDFVTNAIEASRKAEIWVKVPSVSATADTDIWVWYNKPGTSPLPVDDGNGRNQVWSDYEAVTHDGTIDSTGNHTITANGGVTQGGAVGKIGGATYFDGTDDYLSFGAAYDTSKTYTFSTWAAFDNKGTTDKGLYGLAPFALSVWLDIGNGLSIFTFPGDGPGQHDGTTNTGSFVNDQFYYITTVHNGSTFDIYLNGADESIVLNNSTEVRVADILFGKNDLNYFMEGELGESRLRRLDSSLGWTSTEYENQNAPATFATASAPESVSASEVPLGVVSSVGILTGVFPPSVRPDAAKGADWRAQVGWGYTLSSADTVVTSTLATIPVSELDATVVQETDTNVTVTLGDIPVADLDTTVTQETDTSVTVTLGDIPVADLDTTVTQETDTSITVTLGTLPVADLDATVTQEGNINVTATLGDIPIADLDTTVVQETDTNVTATLGDIPVVDLDATVIQEGNIVVTATLGDIPVADLDTTVTQETDTSVTVTLADIPVTDLDTTVTQEVDNNLTAIIGDIPVTDLDTTVTQEVDISITATLETVPVTDLDTTITVLADIVINSSLATVPVTDLDASITTSDPSYSLISAAKVIPGVFPVSIVPNASKDEVWRRQAGWGYTGLDQTNQVSATLATVPVSSLDVTVSQNVDVTINISLETVPVSDLDSTVTQEIDTNVSATLETVPVAEFDSSVTQEIDNNITATLESVPVVDLDSTVVQESDTSIVATLGTIPVTDLDTVVFQGNAIIVYSTLGDIPVSDLDGSVTQEVDNNISVTLGDIPVTDLDTTVTQEVDISLTATLDTIPVVDLDSTITQEVDNNILATLDTVPVVDLDSTITQEADNNISATLGTIPVVALDTAAAFGYIISISRDDVPASGLDATIVQDIDISITSSLGVIPVTSLDTTVLQEIDTTIVSTLETVPVQPYGTTVKQDIDFTISATLDTVPVVTYSGTIVQNADISIGATLDTIPVVSFDTSIEQQVDNNITVSDLSVPVVELDTVILQEIDTFIVSTSTNIPVNTFTTIVISGKPNSSPYIEVEVDNNPEYTILVEGSVREHKITVDTLLEHKVIVDTTIVEYKVLVDTVQEYDIIVDMDTSDLEITYQFSDEFSDDFA